MRDAFHHLGLPDLADWDENFVRVTAPEGPLRRATLVAIDEGGERVSERCTALLRGTGQADAVRAALTDLAGLVELLSSLRESS